MVHISASLLAADYARLGEEVKRAASSGADSFHFDLMDGHYVRNLALAPDHLTALRPHTSLPFFAHLELSNPEEILAQFDPFPADTIIVQWNTLTEPLKTFDAIRLRNAKVGLGLCPDDDIRNAVRLFRDLDLLLLLGVYPGFGGQAMQPDTREKIAFARRLLDEADQRVMIAVDGGVKPENAAALVTAGADMLIMGTALFRSEDMAETIRSIRESIAESQRR
jgi:ribulose-phosphate 3-epimerase